MVRRATCVVSGCWRAHSVLFSQHDCENPHCDRRIGWIWRLPEQRSVVRVDFPKELLACDLNDAEVVLTVRIIVGVEAVEAAHRRAQSDAVSFGECDDTPSLDHLPPTKLRRKASLSVRITATVVAVALRRPPCR